MEVKCIAVLRGAYLYVPLDHASVIKASAIVCKEVSIGVPRLPLGDFTVNKTSREIFSEAFGSQIVNTRTCPRYYTI
jgi:hypothetical protein